MGARGPKERPLADRFWEKVDKRGADECWLWRAGRNQKGFGAIFTPKLRRARDRRRGVMILATRVAFDLAHPHAKLRRNEQAFHTCGNPSCVNPAHLRRGLHTESPTVANLRKGSVPGTNQYANRTHCAHGHEYTAENTRYVQRGGTTRRRCRTCDRATDQRRYNPARRHDRHVRRSAENAAQTA